MTASDCPHGERISPSTSTTPRRQKLNPWMSRGRELRPTWRRWVLPTSICSRMEQRMEAPREGVEVWWSSMEGGEVERLSLPAGRYCSSFTVEAAGLLAAVRWLGEREGWTSAALITDIMSLLQALQGRGGGGAESRTSEESYGTSMATASRSDLRGSPATVDFPEMRLLTRWQGGGASWRRRESESTWQPGWLSPGEGRGGAPS